VDLRHLAKGLCRPYSSLLQPFRSAASLLVCLPGGYDGNDVEFTWLRGNDSVRGLENLRLAQYTIQQYFTWVTTSQQETGNSGYTQNKTTELRHRDALQVRNAISSLLRPFGVQAPLSGDGEGSRVYTSICSTGEQTLGMAAQILHTPHPTPCTKPPGF
jgi:hypothetical protein